MRFRRKSYGGTRPVFTVQPIMVVGGFNLDEEAIKLNTGMIVPAGTLSDYKEEDHTMVILKTARVIGINTGNAKIVTLESNEFLCPVFVVGDKVVKTVSGKFADAPEIKSIASDDEKYVITLNKEITGLSVGDTIMHVVEDESGNAALVSETFPAMVIKDTDVTQDEKNIDITIDTGIGAAYVKRIPPIPENMRKDNFLAANQNIKLSDSY